MEKNKKSSITKREKILYLFLLFITLFFIMIGLYLTNNVFTDVATLIIAVFFGIGGGICTYNILNKE